MDIRFTMADPDGQPISPEKFFGHDARRMDAGIRLIYEAAVGRQYEGCYRAPAMNAFEYRRAHGTLDGYVTYRKSWYHAHPEEEQKELESHKRRDEEVARAFRTVYGIANRRGCFIEWEGNGCEPDRWRLYRNHELVAYMSI